MNSMTKKNDDIFKGLFTEESAKEKESFGVITLHFDFLEEINDYLAKSGKHKSKDLAEILNVKPSFVSQLRSGDKLLNLKMLNKIQKKLGIRFKLTTNDCVVNESKSHNIFLSVNKSNSTIDFDPYYGSYEDKKAFNITNLN